MNSLRITSIVLAVTVSSGCSSLSQRNDYNKLNEPLQKGDLVTALMNTEKLAGDIDL